MRLRDPSGEAARDYQTRRRIVTPTRRCFQIVPVIICLLVVVPRLASAQDTEKLAARIPRMVIDNALENLDIFLGLAIPIDVDEESLLQQIAFTVPLTKTISSQLSSFPLGSSAGGFSWTFDPALGTFDRVSDSFGPVFAERALTVGRGRVNLGVNYQRATFDKFEGVDLDDGIKVYSGSPVVFIQDSLHMKLSTDTLGIFGTYGITDRIDVGVAVPIVRTELDARISGLVFTSSGQFSDAPIERASTSGTASGLGDIVVRGKYNFWSRPGGGLAAGIDVRLPTEMNWICSAWPALRPRCMPRCPLRAPGCRRTSTSAIPSRARARRRRATTSSSSAPPTSSTTPEASTQPSPNG